MPCQRSKPLSRGEGEDKRMELFSLQSPFFFFLLPLLFFLLFYYQNSARKHTSAKAKAYPLLGNLPHLIKHRHRFLEWTTEALADSPSQTMIFKTPVHGGVITANPSNVEHMLKHNFENYPKGERSISMLEDFLGRGIFNSDGEHWRWQRKAASFEFNRKSLRNFVMDTVQDEIVQRLLPLLQRAGERNEVIDLQDVLERFAFDSICMVAFGEDPRCLAEEEEEGDETSANFVKAFGDAAYLTVERFLQPLPFLWRIKKRLNIGSERRLKESISVVRDFATKIIRSRKVGSLDQNDDLLSRFVWNKDHSEEFLRDIVISFMIAGRETTSSALTWFFWLLSSRPDVERKIQEEVASIRSANQNSGDTFSFDELREMHYLHAAISEALRLYPPVPLDTQSCKADDVLPDGTFVGEGWFISYSAYAMARSEDIWGKDCAEYKPERWLEDGNFRPESPFRFPVFHAGPRMCLGKEMAYIQMKSIAACMLERFMINVMVDKHKPPEFLLSFTLKMKTGLPIQVRNKEA